MKYIYIYLWVLPFIAFFLGYYSIQFFAHKKILVMPNLLGQHIGNVLVTLSAQQLNVRILTQKEDADLPDGTIINQSPVQGQKVKSHQAIYIAVTRTPNKPKALKLYGLSYKQALEKTQKVGIQLKAYFVESSQPEGICIAQQALENQELKNALLIAYFSAGITPLRIFPQLKHKTLKEVKEFMQDYNLKAQIFHQDMAHSKKFHDPCDSCIIVDQRPLAGSIINIKKSPLVQITIMHEEK